MAHQQTSAEQATGMRDVTYNLVSVLYHALQGAENYAMYARDAEEAGDNESTRLFRQLVDEERRRAEQVKDLLKRHWST